MDLTLTRLILQQKIGARGSRANCATATAVAAARLAGGHLARYGAETSPRTRPRALGSGATPRSSAPSAVRA